MPDLQDAIKRPSRECQQEDSIHAKILLVGHLACMDISPLITSNAYMTRDPFKCNLLALAGKRGQACAHPGPEVGTKKDMQLLE